jgi:hypothetical protein
MQRLGLPISKKVWDDVLAKAFEVEKNTAR